MPMKHPVIKLKLDESDPEFAKGGRYMLESVDGTKYCFKTDDDSKTWLRIHGCRRTVG